MLLEVALEVPPAITQGLTNGSLERVGGVVREAGSKQIVAWLREGGQIARNPNLLSGSGPLGTLLNVASGGALDIAKLGFEVYSHHKIMQELQSLGINVMFNGLLGLANLAISSSTLIMLIHSVRKLEKQIEELGLEISEEFALQREANIDAGLQAAARPLEQKPPQTDGNMLCKLLTGSEKRRNLS